MNETDQFRSVTCICVCVAFNFIEIFFKKVFPKSLELCYFDDESSKDTTFPQKGKF